MNTEGFFTMPQDDKECGSCHLRFSEFQATGLLGCSACYAQFQEEIDRLLGRQNGPAVHSGKRCAAQAGAAARDEDVKQLKQDLADAVEREAFELAARIRDTLRKRSGTGSCPL